MMKRQYGLGTFALIGLIASLSVVGLLAYKVIPPYLDNMYVEEALRSVVPTDGSKLTKQGIQRKLANFGMVNSFTKDIQDGFFVKRIKGGFIINSVYEVRSPLFMDVDVVVSFKKQLDTTNPDACCEFLVEDFDAKN